MKFLLSSCCAAALCLAPCAHGQKVIGEVYATDATVKGSVELSSGGTRLMSGSSVTAGDATALVKLARGGEVRVCARTSISVSASPSGRELLLAMGTGAIETHYALGASADSLLTPDFRIQMPGPGTFHFSFGTDAKGNTCVHSLSMNSAAVIVNELMGDGSYQVRPGERVRFAHGSLAAASQDEGECGCPPPPPVLKTSAPAPADARSVQQAQVTQAVTPAEAAMMAPPPPDPTGVHVTLDAPFVYSAGEPPPPPPVRIPDAPPMQRRTLSSLPAIPQPEVLPPPPPPPAVAATKPAKKGFFGRLRGFFASIFH